MATSIGSLDAASAAGERRARVRTSLEAARVPVEECAAAPGQTAGAFTLPLLSST
jgi:hypothetical protein